MMVRSIDAAAVIAGILAHIDVVTARECKVFTPDELKAGSYQNVDGCTVPRPQAASCPPPRDADYRCGDGDWSYAQHR